MTTAKKKVKDEEVNAQEETKSVAVVNSSVPAEFLDDVAADAGLGHETMDAQDFTIPRLGIIQSLSPQRSKTKAEYIEGSVEGQFFNSVTKELYAGDTGLIVVPIMYQRVYLEWADRNSKTKQGLQKNHGRDSTAYDKARVVDGKHWTSDDTFISPTAEYFVFLVNPTTGAATPAVLSLAGTQLKHAKRWNVMINQLKLQDKDNKPFTPPIFYQAYQLTTVPESNKKGEWFRIEVKNFKSVFELPNGSFIYAEAKKFREQVAKGAVKTADAVDDSEASSASSDEEKPL